MLGTLLSIGIGASAAAVGIGKAIKAGIDQSDANDTNEYAKNMVDAATERANDCRKNSCKAIENLGCKKIWVLHNSMQSFIHLFEQIHSIELTDSAGLNELNNFTIDKQALIELKKMSAVASSIAGGMAGGAALGAVTAFGAYSGAMALGACATTGTAIASLSGVAATNATLAFLGGGALSVGGLGIAGGTVVLGGLVAGPALAVMGFVVGAKASANKEAAYSNLAQAREYAEEAKTVQILCKAIRMRASMFERLLIKLDAIFEPLIDSFERIIQTSGNEYSHYSDEEKAIVAASLSIAKAIKVILDTPLLTKDGNLTKESEVVIAPVQKVIDSFENV